MKIGIKILSLLFAAMLIFPAVPAMSASAETAETGCSYTLTKNDDGADTYTAAIDIGAGGSTTISAAETDLARNYSGKVTRIEVAEGVEALDSDCFRGFTALREADLPDSLLSIGDAAFNGCVCLQDIEIPDSVTSIGESALNDTGCIPSTVSLPEGCGAYGNALETAKIFYDMKPDAISPDAPETATYMSQFEESYAKVTEILSDLELSSKTNDLEKIQSIYHWVTDNVSIVQIPYFPIMPDPDYAEQLFRYLTTAHSAMFDGRALSSGGTDLTEMLLKESGIRCIECSGADRSWLIIELDGIWYAADPSMDVGRETLDYTYFLKPYDFFSEFNHDWNLPEGFTDVYPINDENYGRVTADGCECVIYPGFAVMTRYRGEDPTVTLPRTVTYKGTEYPVTQIGGNAFYENADLQEVVIPSGYESISLAAFHQCGSIGRITLPETLDSISYEALRDSSVSELCFDRESDQLLGTEWLKIICRSFNPQQIVFPDRQLPNPYCISTAEIQMTPEAFVYSGQPQMPEITVTAADGTVLTRGEDYEIYINDDDPATAKKVDRYTICIEGTGDYYGTKYSDEPYFINPRASYIKRLKSGKRKMTVKWKKRSVQIKGYEIQYARDSQFTQDVKTRTINKYKTTSCTINKLKKKKTYYVRIRTFKIGEYTGDKLYSSWSKAKKVRVK
ncbi:MAG: leucine-rich repeat protein [Bacillota bacterium]|nr:leucine-rich repeat protein [Bacillota bacterium]